MEHPPSHDQERDPRSYASTPKRRRRFSVWTIIAPAAAVVLWISFFIALGDSCVLRECAGEKASSSEQAADDGDKRNTLDQGAKYKVKDGDSLGAIAARYDLTEEELKACNPLVDPQAMQPGDRMLVSAVDCEEADKAETGANPDPLAGETAEGASEANATAKADPSANDGEATPVPDSDDEKSKKDADA